MMHEIADLPLHGFTKSPWKKHPDTLEKGGKTAPKASGADTAATGGMAAENKNTLLTGNNMRSRMRGMVTSMQQQKGPTLIQGPLLASSLAKNDFALGKKFFASENQATPVGGNPARAVAGMVRNKTLGS